MCAINVETAQGHDLPFCDPYITAKFNSVTRRLNFFTSSEPEVLDAEGVTLVSYN